MVTIGNPIPAYVDPDGTIYISFPHILVATGLAESTSEAKRLIKQRAIKLEGKPVVDEYIAVEGLHD